ncbi:MAG: hypothetical protein KFF72_19580 [Arthrospira sp. SH-MAG29]|nr:hypothetical protein [Arthrospira sp. SH-MAG29]MBS0018518.1 hypothetical protein [Arthrospira sp. SH-MAG29]
MKPDQTPKPIKIDRNHVEKPFLEQLPRGHHGDRIAIALVLIKDGFGLGATGPATFSGDTGRWLTPLYH